MENFIVWNCAKESSVFILNLTFQRLNIACDLLGQKVVDNLRLPFKTPQTCLQLITALNNCIFVFLR